MYICMNLHIYTSVDRYVHIFVHMILHKRMVRLYFMKASVEGVRSGEKYFVLITSNIGNVPLYLLQNKCKDVDMAVVNELTILLRNVRCIHNNYMVNLLRSTRHVFLLLIAILTFYWPHKIVHALLLDHIHVE